MSSYDDVISITKFAGINQSGDGYNTDMKYASDGYGFDTTLGGFKPFPKIKLDDHVVAQSGVMPRTLAFLNKRWVKRNGNVVATDSYCNSYAISSINGKLMYNRSIFREFAKDENAWVNILWDNGSPVELSTVDRFDFVNYEINYTPPVAYSNTIKTAVQGGAKWFVMVHNGTDFGYYELEYNSSSSKCRYKNNAGQYVEVSEYEDEAQHPTRVAQAYDAPVDALLITNSDNGMYCIYAPLEYDVSYEHDTTPTLKIAPVHVKPTTDLTTPDPDDIRFGCVELYNERIFGSGIDSDPDKLMYSALNDPFNWEANIVSGLEADGAGDIQQPSWDGDKFVSLKAFSNMLLCFKKQSIWRISGSNPSEFTFKKAYGEGTINDASVVTHGYYTYFLTDDGIKLFDGTGTSYLKYGWIKNDFFANRKCFGAEKLGDYYALSVDGKGILLYNTVEGTFNVYEVPSEYQISAIKANNGKLYAFVCEEKYDGDEEEFDGGTYYNVALVNLFEEHYSDSNGLIVNDVVWESSWIDLSAKNITKSSFSVYMLLADEVVSSDATVTVKGKVSIISERKTKTKEVEWKVNKPKKININNSGRLYKLRIEIPSEVDGVAQHGGWSMSAGIQMYLEYDYD